MVDGYFLESKQHLVNTVDQIKTKTEELNTARDELEHFEAMIESQEAVRSELKKDKNSDERRLTLRRYYRMSPNQNVWDGLQEKVKKLENEISLLNLDRDLHKDVMYASSRIQ